MARKTSRKLVYTLSSESSHHGHSLGVNSLAIDPNPPAPDSLLYAPPPQDASINKPSDSSVGSPSLPSGTLYSAGRDGTINAWRIYDTDLAPQDYFSDPLASRTAQLDNATSSPNETVMFDTARSRRPSTIHRHSFQDADISTSSISKLLGPSLAAFLQAPPPDNITSHPNNLKSSLNGFTTFGLSGQNHTNWVNDIVLVNNYTQGKFYAPPTLCITNVIKLSHVHRISQSSCGTPIRTLNTLSASIGTM